MSVDVPELGSQVMARKALYVAGSTHPNPLLERRGS